ncbi:hypothetical protein PL78_12330 [Yersinia entomophaga]|uniref:Beta-gamma-crystallin n=1 Tax=Yersinia entomophaga TaxID=935293 RepID=A0ABN4PUC1_YERET|nr:hypothetical protein [Yersinia entomophaga]ANI30609.1 hypothetical protein PL78_12330 [Yersinia entomophaga]OWF87982.1 hypothetical protein B4914_09255 [Yersinia entomophaga]
MYKNILIIILSSFLLTGAPSIVLSQDLPYTNRINDIGPIYDYDEPGIESGYTLIQPEEIIYLDINDIFSQHWQSRKETSVSNPYLDCDTDCTILQKKIIPLNEIFTQAAIDPNHSSQQVLLSFALTETNEFNFSIGQYLDIIVDKNSVRLLGGAVPKGIETPLNHHSNQLTFLFHVQDQQLSMSYMESDSTQQRYLSPTINLEIKKSKEINYWPDIEIFNPNPGNPILVKKILLTSQSTHSRFKRGIAGKIGCYLSGPLALYNLVVQGHCTQVESAWSSIKSFFAGKDSTKMIVIAGNPIPLKPTVTPPSEQTDNLNAFELSVLNTHLHHQALTLPAAADFCHTSIDEIKGARYPRQIRHTCANWLSVVLQDFTLLFGNSLRTWSAEYLTQTLNGILDRQAIDNDNDAQDAFIRQPAAGVRLIQTIADIADREGRAEVIEQVSGAFTHAVQNYANYVMTQPSSGPCTPSCSDSSSSHSSCSCSDCDIDSPLAAQELPLGTYQLTLSAYIPQHTQPLILQNGLWVEPAQGFDIEIIRGTFAETRQQRYELMETIQLWRNAYIEKRVYCNKYGNFPTQIDTARFAGQSTSTLLRSTLRYFDENNLIAVVRFNNQIINVSAVSRFSDPDEDASIIQANIIATLTHPAYVLTPNNEGTVRRAGTAALHQLIQQLIADGVQTLSSHVISTPSAIVKKRLGFSFIPDKPHSITPTPNSDL